MTITPRPPVLSTRKAAPPVLALWGSMLALALLLPGSALALDTDASGVVSASTAVHVDVPSAAEGADGTRASTLDDAHPTEGGASSAALALGVATTEDPLSVARLQGPILTQAPVALQLHTKLGEGGGTSGFGGPGASEGGNGGSHAQSGAGWVGTGEALVRADTTSVAAVGALAALGTLLLQFEPVRRGAFMLALPLYSRLKRSELLDNQVRERIYRAVEGNPGLRIIDVCRGSEVGWGTAVYHLQRLERDRMVVSRRDGPYRRFFLNGKAPDLAAQPPGAKTLRHALARDIAAFVLANPHAVQKDICRALGISAPLASKWLGRLAEEDLVTTEREWKHVRYAPTPALQEALAAHAPVEVEPGPAPLPAT